MDDVEKVCDRVMIIVDGGKVYDDKLSELIAAHSKERYVKFIFKKVPDRKLLEHYGEISHQDENSYTMKLDSAEMPAVIAKITSKYKLFDIDIVSIPLDEIIADLFKMKKN